MSKSEQYIIKTKEIYGNECLNDSFNRENDQIRKGTNYVEIIERDIHGNEKNLHKENLVVYTGREMIAQRIVNVNNPNSVEMPNEYISWLGVGDGGTNPSDPFNPAPPISTDVDLYHSVPISATDTTCADYHDGFFYKAPIDEITFEQDTLNDDSWLIVRTVTNIGLERCNGQQINEAGLFTAVTNASGYEGPFHLFARITFPTLIKTQTRELIFVWYLYT